MTAENSSFLRRWTAVPSNAGRAKKCVINLRGRLGKLQSKCANIRKHIAARWIPYQLLLSLDTTIARADYGNSRPLLSRRGSVSPDRLRKTLSRSRSPEKPERNLD